MSTSAETKAQSWPGTSSQLTSGAGTVVSVSPASALSGGVLSVGGSRNPIDANHTNVWYLDETGSTYANQVAGSPSMTGTKTAPFVGPVFKQFSAVGPTSAATLASSGSVVPASTISVAATDDVTLEMVMRVSPGAAINTGDAFVLVPVDADNGLWFYRRANNNCWEWWSRRVSGANSAMFASIAEGAGSNQFARGVVHHVMMTYSAAGAVAAYLDGEQIATASPGARSATWAINSMLLVFPGVYVGDVRVSKSIRDLTYARKAYAAALAC